MRRHLVTSLFVLALVAPAASLLADDVDAPPQEPQRQAEAGGAVKFEESLSFDEALARAKETGKHLFVEFSTDWCTWCRKLDAETFSDPAVGKLMQGFVNLRVDAEKGEGPDLARRFAVRGFPTLVVVGPDGLEVDRIVGYVPAEVFQDELRRIQSGEGTLAALRKASESAPADVEAGMAYGAKLAYSQPAEAAALYERLAGQASDNDPELRAKIGLEHAASLLNAGRREDAAAAAERLLEQFPDSAVAAQAAPRVGRAFLAINDFPRAIAFVEKLRTVAQEDSDKVSIEELAVSVHRTAIAASLRHQAELAGDDANLLNEVAWTSFEQKVNVREAITWARKAVELSERDPAILDTLANLLWLVGEHDEALELEKEAVKKAQGAMHLEFHVNLAKWNAELEFLRSLEEGGPGEIDETDGAPEDAPDMDDDVPPPSDTGTR
jgi:tetratricopeptide (TPR) repeat protein